jgi:V8-like Glu-specific endopeptidase
VYVVGHPLGGGVSFSLQDNLLLDWDQRLVHYRTPTEPGSSGSPVFDDQWRLIAIHHAGGSNMRKLNGKPGTYKANEGINILAIIEQIMLRLRTA